jgi:hypothetical protein
MTTTPASIHTSDNVDYVPSSFPSVAHAHETNGIIGNLSSAVAADLLITISTLDARRPEDHPEISNILRVLVKWQDRRDSEELVMQWIHWLAQVRY